MLIKNTIKAQNQPIHWRQAICQSQRKKFSWKNFYIYPLTTWIFPYRNYLSYLTDVVILGSNPIVTHLLLVKLYKENLQNFINHGIKLKVTILKDNNSDYWSYHSLKQQEMVDYMNYHSDLKLKKVEDIFDYYSDVYSENSSLEISIISNNNMSVYYYFRKEEFVDGYVFHVQDKVIIDNDYQKSMPNITLLENSIKEDFWYLLKSKMNKHGYLLNYDKEKKNNTANNTKSHLLLTKKVLLTSMAGWVNSETIIEEKMLENQPIAVTRFINDLSQYSYGSAWGSAQDFVNNKLMCVNQIIDLINTTKKVD